MRITRIQIDAELQPGQQIELPAAAAEHLVRVLRLPEGARICLFNGDGADYDARLLPGGKRSAQAIIDARRVVDTESPLRLHLAQGIARGDKMDWILQKAVELGVAGIHPVLTERTEVKLDAERSERRMGHWRGVMVSACEQSGRATLPLLSEPQSLANFAANCGFERRYALTPEAEQGAASLETGGEILLVVGPEGGLGERDLAILKAAGFRGLRLGPRILRTETAGLAALAALQALHGDMG